MSQQLVYSSGDYWRRTDEYQRMVTVFREVAEGKTECIMLETYINLVVQVGSLIA